MSLPSYDDDLSGLTPMTEVAFYDPARAVALGMAIDFHHASNSDDSKTVVETAQDFLSFLLDGKHEAH